MVRKSARDRIKLRHDLLESINPGEAPDLWNKRIFAFKNGERFRRDENGEKTKEQLLTDNEMISAKTKEEIHRSAGQSDKSQRIAFDALLEHGFILEFESKEVTRLREKTGTNTFYVKTEEGIAELEKLIGYVRMESRILEQHEEARQKKIKNKEENLTK